MFTRSHHIYVKIEIVCPCKKCTYWIISIYMVRKKFQLHKNCFQTFFYNFILLEIIKQDHNLMIWATIGNSKKINTSSMSSVCPAHCQSGHCMWNRHILILEPRNIETLQRHFWHWSYLARNFKIRTLFQSKMLQQQAQIICQNVCL